MENTHAVSVSWVRITVVNHSHSTKSTSCLANAVCKKKKKCFKNISWKLDMDRTDALHMEKNTVAHWLS